MKKLSTLFSVLALGAALSFTACKKDEKDADETKAKPTETDKAAADKAAADKAAAPAGDTAAPAGDTAAPAGGGDSTGNADCDALLAKMKCMAEKTPDAAAKQQALDGLKASADAWRQALSNEASKEQTAATCKQSLEQGKAGYDAMGC